MRARRCFVLVMQEVMLLFRAMGVYMLQDASVMSQLSGLTLKLAVNMSTTLPQPAPSTARP